MNKKDRFNAFVFLDGMNYLKINENSDSKIIFIDETSYAKIDLDEIDSFDKIDSVLKKINGEKKDYVLISNRSNEIYNKEKYLIRFIESLLNQGFSVNVKDVPLCYLQEYPELSYELKLKLLSEEGIITGFKETGSFFEDCDYCNLKSVCPGYSKKYENQVFAVFKNKDSIIRSVKHSLNINTKVAVLGKFKDYSDLDLITKKIKSGFDFFGGLEKVIPRDSKILIKPNLAEPFTPDKAATTHPQVIKAIVRVLKERTNKIFISDLSAGTNYKKHEELMEITGMKKIAEEENVKIVNLSLGDFPEKKIKNYYWVEKTNVVDFLDEIDFIINVPKLKTHGITFFTGCIKAVFGLIHPEERKYIHSIEDKVKFAQGIIDVYSIIKDKIAMNIMDGIIGMEGDEGPSYGDPKLVGLIILGKDGVAVDSVSSKLIGYDALNLPIIKYADLKSIGIGNLEEIEIVGDFKDFDEFYVLDFKKNSLFDYLNTKKKEQGYGKLFVYEAYIDQDKCKKCYTCFESCPVGAIYKSNDSVYIDQEKCIHCYTCQEVCPHGSVSLKKVNNL